MHANSLRRIQFRIGHLAAVMMLCTACGGGGGAQVAPVLAPPSGISLIAGSLTGEEGSADGVGAAARFRWADGVAVDSSGTMFVTDSFNRTIRKITPAGVVSTFAGTPGEDGFDDGLGAAARFTGPHGIAIDAAGNLFVADFGLRIRKVTPAGLVTTVATIPFGANSARAGATFSPSGVAVDGSGALYVPNGIGTRKIATSGAVSILEGVNNMDGLFGTGYFLRRGVTVDNTGNVYLVNLQSAISKVGPDNTLLPFVGTPGITGSADGTGAAASFSQNLSALATDAKGNLYVADSGNHTIRKITPAGVVTTVAGRAGVAGNVLGALPGGLWSPSGIAVDRNGDLIVVSNNALLKIQLPAQ